MERAAGIEPATCPWQGYVLPLAPCPLLVPHLRVELRTLFLLREATLPICPVGQIGAGLPPAANQTTPNSKVINLPPLYIQWTFNWMRGQESHLDDRAYETDRALASPQCYLWCLERELNSHSSDYESPALPLSYQGIILVRLAGLEPACISAADFKSAVYTSSTTVANTTAI